METTIKNDPKTKTKDGLFREETNVDINYKIYKNGVLTFDVYKRKNPVDGEERFFGQQKIYTINEMIRLSIKDAEKWWMYFNVEYYKMNEKIESDLNNKNLVTKIRQLIFGLTKNNSK